MQVVFFTICGAFLLHFTPVRGPLYLCGDLFPNIFLWDAFFSMCFFLLMGGGGFFWACPSPIRKFLRASMGAPVTVVRRDKQIGNSISTDNYDRNIISNVCHFYQRSNSVISDSWLGAK